MKYTLNTAQAAALQALNTQAATFVPCWGDDGITADTNDMQAEAFAAHIAYLSDLTPQVPKQVTALQARLEIVARGAYAGVKAAVASLDEEAQVTFEYAEHWRRDSALIAQLKAGFDWSDADVDAMFISAAQR